MIVQLTTVIATAVREVMKRVTKDLLDKDEYKVGDISKELDARVKDEVAKMRGKEEYELGDLTKVMDDVAKDLVCEYTGKAKGEYEFGDLSAAIDADVKKSVARFCGKESYEVGDLTKEVAKRAATLAAEFTGKGAYEFGTNLQGLKLLPLSSVFPVHWSRVLYTGDVSKEIERRRVEWITDFIGAEAAKDYEFGSITKKAITNFTGKEDYQFGDVTKKVFGSFFGDKKGDKK